MVAGLRKKGTLLLRDIVIHREPMTIRNKLNKANIAPVICKPKRETKQALSYIGFNTRSLHNFTI